MKISIIIITWNRVKSLVETIDNIQKDPYTNKEIIVVDNNSSDNTREILSVKYPDVILICSDKNLGVPGGRNLGIKNAKGDILFFIDNDAVLMENGLARIQSHFLKNPDLGVLALKITNYYSKKLDITSWVYGIHKLRDHDKSFETFYFVGCSFAVKKEVFDTCGVLWDKLFFMHEEQDFAHRVINGGYVIQYFPDVVVEHKVDSECRYDTSSRFYEFGTRNQIWITLRYYPYAVATFKLFYFLFFQFIASLKSKNVQAYFRSLISAFSNIRMPINERQVLPGEIRRKIAKLRQVKKDSIYIRIKRYLGLSHFNYENV